MLQKSDVIEFFGGRELAAHATGVTSGAVDAWPHQIQRGSSLEGKIALAGIRAVGIHAVRKAFPGLLDG